MGGSGAGSVVDARAVETPPTTQVAEHSFSRVLVECRTPPGRSQAPDSRATGPAAPASFLKGV